MNWKKVALQSCSNTISANHQLYGTGAFEIPFGIKSYWENAGKKKRPDAFIALGCVLRGHTPHFDYICKAVTDGIVQLNMLLRYLRSLAYLPSIPTTRPAKGLEELTAIKRRGGNYCT